MKINQKDQSIMVKTGNKSGITTNNNTITKLMLCKTKFPKNTKIVDFGSGLNANQTIRLKKKFPNVKAYDFDETILKSIENNPNLSKVFDQNALSNDPDLIIASNVMNVQTNAKTLKHTLNKLYCSMDSKTKLILNIPKEPIKYQSNNKPITHKSLVKIIKRELSKRFGKDNIKKIDSVCNKKTNTLIYEITKISNDTDKKFCRI